MLGRLTRLVWAALDGIGYVITDTRLRLFDLIYVPSYQVGPTRIRSSSCAPTWSH